jgi:hypothetical protein
MASAKLPFITASHPYSTEPEVEQPRWGFLTDRAVIMTLPVKRASKCTSVARAILLCNIV